jgi:hypothetical protein
MNMANPFWMLETFRKDYVAGEEQLLGLVGELPYPLQVVLAELVLAEFHLDLLLFYPLLLPF